MLFDGGMKQALHCAVFTDTRHYVALQAVLRVQASWLEPLNIGWIVKHVLDDRISLLHFDGVARQHNALENQAIGIGTQDRPNGYNSVVLKHQHWCRSVRNGTKDAGSSKHWQKTFERVFVAIQIQL